MSHPISKRLGSKVSLRIQTLLFHAGRLHSDLRNHFQRIARFEETDSVEGQSRSFRIWMFSSFGALVCILLLNLSARSDNNSHATPKFEAPDLVSQIPAGHVLVPIEPMNLDAIDAVFGNHGWADLFVEHDGVDADFRRSNKPSRRRIAVGIPIVRAPRNPSRLAVIVAETETQIISELGQPVHVALRKSAPQKTKSGSSSKDHTTSRRRPGAAIGLELVHEDGIEESI